MVDIVRIIDGTEPQPPGPWDTVWSQAIGAPDWAVADPAVEPGNVGGLAASSPLATAIILCLFTDKRRPPDMPRDGDGNDGGWHGDSFDIDRNAGEREMGSLLWTLARGPINFTTLRMAEHYAAEALQTLIDQRAVSRFDIAAVPEKVTGKIVLHVAAFGPSPRPLFADTFPLL